MLHVLVGYHIVVRWSSIADLSWDCSFKSLTIICNHSFLNVCLFVCLFFDTANVSMPRDDTLPPTHKKKFRLRIFFCFNPCTEFGPPSFFLSFPLFRREHKRDLIG